MLVMTALAIVRIRRLFAVAMLSGVFSLLSALLFVVLDAVDVAFTEAAVGAGISTVLMLGTLAAVLVLVQSGSLATMVLAFAASSAAALTPEAPHCERADLSAAEAAYAGYSFSMTGEGFVIYDRRLIAGGRWEYILEHCPTRERLVVAVEGDSEAEIRQRFYDVTGPILAAIESDRAFTLRDLRRLATDQGGEATLGIGNEQSCVCAAIGY